jgi:hypothetical protein
MARSKVKIKWNIHLIFALSNNFHQCNQTYSLIVVAVVIIIIITIRQLQVPNALLLQKELWTCCISGFRQDRERDERRKYSSTFSYLSYFMDFA